MVTGGWMPRLFAGWLAARRKKGMFVMQLFSEIELPERGETKRKREKDALREDNVGIAFSPHNNKRLLSEKNVAYLRGTALQPRLPFHKK